MKCTICDKCKKIIDDPGQVRILTLSRPMKPAACASGAVRTYDQSTVTQPTNDVVWEKELCIECAAEVEGTITKAD